MKFRMFLFKIKSVIKIPFMIVIIPSMAIVFMVKNRINSRVMFLSRIEEYREFIFETLDKQKGVDVLFGAVVWVFVIKFIFFR